MIRRLVPFLLAALTLLLSYPLHGQMQAFGRIVGQIRVLRGDSPGRRILIELQHRGAAMDSVYADAQGHFYFLTFQAANIMSSSMTRRMSPLMND